MAVNISSRGITLTWADVATSTRYQVMYTQMRGVSEGVNTTEAVATFSNLSPGVNYTFTVTVYDHLDQASAPSDPLTVMTLEEGTYDCKSLHIIIEWLN